jgi:cyclopropane fatty-acyl-phospholipid synthase-like methyltransferase
MTMSAITGSPDAVEARQQRMWARGDYAAVAARIHPIAERLCEAGDLVPGARVLDVATGSGNAAIAAARRECDVVGVDYVPALLERAHVRARAEGLAIELKAMFLAPAGTKEFLKAAPQPKGCHL